MHHGLTAIVLTACAMLAGCPGDTLNAPSDGLPPSEDSSPIQWPDPQPSDSVVLGEVALSVLSVHPPAGATDVPSTSVIRVTFNGAVDPSSLVNVYTNTPTGALILKDENGADVPGVVTYNAATRTATFSPAQALAPGRRYTVIVRDVYDSRGIALKESQEWSFLTLSATAERRLAVSSTYPLPGATGFPRNGAIRVTFDKELDPTSLINPTTNTSTGAFLLKTPAGANVAGTVTYNPSTSTVDFVPSAYLSANVTYIASVKDVRTLDGQALAEPYTWTFSTGVEPGALPAILVTTPADGAVGVPRNASIQATFSEPVTGIAAGTFVVRDMNTNAVLTARSLVFDSVTLTATFRPQNNFSPNTLYSVTVQDVVGVNGFLMPQYIWSFTTGDHPDTTPSLISTTPGPGQTGVARNVHVQAVFDRPVSTVAAANFLLRNSLTNTLVTAETVVFSAATRTARFVPAAFLAANTRYTATLRNVAGVDGVQLPEQSWEFTTGAAPDNVAPTVTAAGLAVRANCAGEATLTWSPASDDVTPQSEITYHGFLAQSTGGYDLNAPAFVTSPGTTSRRVAGLAPGATYFFTVRAVDASGNRSVSFTERSTAIPATFACPRTIPVAGAPTAIASADFNGDGRLDLAVASVATGSIAILLGNGDGTFAPATPATLTVGAQPVAVAVADMTNDAQPDLIVACRGAGQIAVLPGAGDGSFGGPINRAIIGPRSITVADFSNPADGNVDVAVATGTAISVLTGNGNGTFGGTVLSLTVAATADAAAVSASDFDGDGLTDIGVCYAATDNAAVWLNATPSGGAVAFTAPSTATNRLFTVQNGPAAVLAVDLDGDGRSDLAVCNAATPSVTVRISSGVSSNLFPGGENTALSAGSLPFAVAAADLDRDGLPDLMTAHRGAGTIGSLLNLAGSSLFLLENSDSGSLPSGIAVGDFNGDGVPDAAVANAGDNTVSILLNVR